MTGVFYVPFGNTGVDRTPNKSQHRKLTLVEQTPNKNLHRKLTLVEQTPNKSLHRKLTLEENIFLPLLPGFELVTFR